MSGLDDDPEDGPRKRSRPGLPVDPVRLWRALLRGKWWILTAGLVGSAMGVGVGKFAIPHAYEATASIRYEGLPGQEPHDAQRKLPAIVSIAHSEPVLNELRARLGLEDVTLTALLQIVDVRTDAAGSGLVTFTMTDDSPEGAAHGANSLVEIFLNHHRRALEVQIRREIASLDERITASQEELNEARTTYDTFRDSHGITDLSAEQEQAITQAAELRSEADLARAEVEALEARIAEIRRAIARTPRRETSTSGPSHAERRLGHLRQQLREARGAGLSAEHPEVQSLERQVRSLERSESAPDFNDSARTSISSLYASLESNLSNAQADLQATRQRHQSLQELARQAQERTNRFSTIEGQAAGLLARVNVKDALLNELNERRSRLEDQLRDIQTGFRSVAEARPPESAVKSKKKLLVAAAIPLGFVSIMIAMLLFRDLRGLKAQTPREVAWWGNGPVVGSTTWPRDPRALIDLVADMDDFAPAARGTMLVVGATPSDYELAAEIASQLNHDWSSSTLIDVPIVGALPPGGLTEPASDGGSDARGPIAPAESREEGSRSNEVSSGRSGSPATEGSSNTESSDGELEDEASDDQIVEVLEDDDVLILAEEADDFAPFEIVPREMAYAASRRDTGGRMVGRSQVVSPAPHAARFLDARYRLVCTAWRGPEGQALRRAARLAHRVMIVVTSDALAARELVRQKTRVGRRDGVGYCLIGISDEVAQLPDRSGEVEEFWIPKRLR